MRGSKPIVAIRPFFLAILAVWILAAATGVATSASAGPADAPANAEEAEVAVCPVCRIREGTTQGETIRARRTANGVVYGFCSEACAEEFDRHGERYLATADSLRAHPTAAPAGSGLFAEPIPSTTPT